MSNLTDHLSSPNAVTPQRRFEDFTPAGSQPTIKDVWEILVDIRDRMETVERKQSNLATAFTLNDLHKPDYDGHRKDHVEIVQNRKIMDSYKTEATKKVLAVLVVFALGLMANGLGAKVAEHIK